MWAGWPDIALFFYGYRMDETPNKRAPSQGMNFSQALPWLLFISGLFFLCFMARIIYAPLLPAIEADTGISHTQACRFFLFISGGYALGLVGSGFITCRLHNRSTVVLSTLWVGITLISVYFCQSLWLMYLLLFVFGLGAGFYLPSGISVIVSLVKPKDIGKAISVHELAPNLAFFLAPFAVELLLRFFHWRFILVILGILSILAAAAFALIGRGDASTTRPPRLGHFTVFARRPAFWTLSAVSCMGVGCTMGTFSVLPIFLIDVHGFEADWGNTLVALSRAGCPFAAIFAGWLSDRIGSVKAMTINIILAGLLTVLLGLTSGTVFIICVLVQAIPATAVFPAYFSVISQIFPAEERNMAVGLIVPFGVLGGAGIIPALIGVLADRDLFYLGFIALGILTLATVPLALLLRRAELASQPTCGQNPGRPPSR